FTSSVRAFAVLPLGLRGGTQKNNASVLSVYLDWWTDGNKKGTKSAKTEKEKVSTTNTSSINKENTSDGRQSDGGFGGLATTVNKGIGGNFSVAECPPSVNGSAHMAQSSFKKPSGPWIFDCGATDTMTYEDIRTRRIIRRGTEREGLYYVNEVTTSGTMMLAHGTSEREAWLWHRRSDNGGEYMNSQMNLFFQSKGLVHQTTFPHTPEQNDVTERKNRLLLEMTRALIIESNVPKTFWPEALATATYLINRLPTKILKMKTPLETLTEYHTLPQVLTLEPKVFGCTIFGHIPKTYRDKLDSCAEKCVFVGCGVNQKGYRCYNLKTHHMFTTMNCDFLETNYFYSPQHSSHGEEQCDTLSWVRYTSEESCPNQNTTSVGAQEQSSLNISAIEDTIPNLISEVSDSQPSDSLDEIQENIHETEGCRNMKNLL
nr:retrovirus-related Pol polyprotein from transposon TNT 1-94 [Tanacetum cinerariifolium]